MEFIEKIENVLKQHCIDYKMFNESIQLESIQQALNTGRHRSYFLKLNSILSLTTTKELLYLNQLEEKYKLNCKLLYHGTLLSNFEKIIIEGFQINSNLNGSLRNNGINLLGKGIYFSDVACKAAQYSKSRYSNSGILLEVKVWIGKHIELNKLEKNIDKKPSDYDTIFLKEGILLPNGEKLIDNEYCVYNNKHCAIKNIYLITFIPFYKMKNEIY